MLKTLLLLAIPVVLFGCKDKPSDTAPSEEKTTTYYFIRHAEKDRSDPDNRDPELKTVGKVRALYWASYFDTIVLEAVYSTNYKRTMQTAKPTAENKKLEIKNYDPANLFDANFQLKTHHKKVLVVGHSNTTPAFVNAVLGKDRFAQMQDNDNASLFVVTLKDTLSWVEVRTVDGM